MKDGHDSFSPTAFFFFFSFYSHTCGIWKFLGWGQIGAAAAGPHHSHSDARSELLCNLHCISQQCRILNPLSKARDRTNILMGTGWVCYRWATTRTPPIAFFRPREGKRISGVWNPGWHSLLVTVLTNFALFGICLYNF